MSGNGSGAPTFNFSNNKTPASSSSSTFSFTFTSPVTRSFDYPAASTQTQPTTPAFSFNAKRQQTDISNIPNKKQGLSGTTTPSNTGWFGFTPPTATLAVPPASASTATTTSGFTFTPPTTSTATQSSAFSFTPRSAPKASVFTFPPPTASATTTSTPSAVSTPSFAFGSKPAETKSTESTSKPTIGSFTFNAPKQGSKTTDDIGKTSTAPPPTFPLAAPKTSASITTPLFTFGSTPASSTSTPAFTFSTEKKDNMPGTTTTTSIPTAAAPAATPTPTNAFSFAKVLEDLEKATAQAPNQIYATLIPSVHHTSFRIDNIRPSTRFRELPQQAQNELDELEKYIWLENQRCEYIANHKTRQYEDITLKTKKHIEMLTQQLDAVGSMLEGQKSSVEAILDNARKQLSHANDGCAILEACKRPGNNARWLFGYAEEDDYFLQLSRQLSGRLEEYRKCIWEIERTAEAWTQNKVQSPQDIANIMRAQNLTFLALSNTVALLHENVNAEKNNYHRYLQLKMNS